MRTIKSISICFLCTLAMSLGPTKTYAQANLEVEVTVKDAPPPLPVYTQPPCPEDGYFWTPGYWAYNGDGGYYWVPGVWVRPPHFGYLWTPCYWGFRNGYYGFHAGYWGLHIGYYGGINYGYGYGGSGYYGGRWVGEHFHYNTAVVNVNTTVVHNTYVDRTMVVNNNTVNRSSYNGPGGVSGSSTRREEKATREEHVAPTTEQTSHQQVASQDRTQFASENKGLPSTAAMNRVGGQGFNAQGHPATIQPTTRSNQENNKRDQQQMSKVQDNNAQKRNVNPAVTDKQEAQTRTPEAASTNNNRTAQSAEKQNTKKPNNNVKKHPHKVKHQKKEKRKAKEEK